MCISFFPDAASGKTYLAKTLLRYFSAGDPVLPFTYTDYQKKVNLESLLNRYKIKLLVIDRYDLYKDDIGIQRTIEMASRDMIVLIDLKGNPPAFQLPVTYVDISFSEREIEVGL